jgi:hypothetical protein
VTQADLDAYLASIKAKVKGAIIFYGAHVQVAENFVPAPLRRTDEQWAQGGRGGGRGGQPTATPPTANPPAGNPPAAGQPPANAAAAAAGGGRRGGGGAGQGGAGANATQPQGLTGQQIAQQVNKFLIDNGAAVK